MSKYTDDGISRLIQAIATQAAEDFRSVFKRNLYGYPVTDEQKYLFDAAERYFHSNDFKIMYDIDGDYILNKIINKESKRKAELSPKELKRIQKQVDAAWEKKRKRDAELAAKRAENEAKKKTKPIKQEQVA